MEHNQPEERQDADKEFLQSLDQLEDILHEEEQTPPQKPQFKPPTPTQAKPQQAKSSMEIDLAAWEDAIADIEQYFANKEKGEG